MKRCEQISIKIPTFSSETIFAETLVKLHQISFFISKYRITKLTRYMYLYWFHEFLHYAMRTVEKYSSTITVWKNKKFTDMQIFFRQNILQ